METSTQVGGAKKCVVMVISTVCKSVEIISLLHIPLVQDSLFLEKVALQSLVLPLALVAHKTLFQRGRGLVTLCVELQIYSERCIHVNK